MKFIVDCKYSLFTFFKSTVHNRQSPMSLWFKDYKLSDLPSYTENMVETLGIKIIELGPDFIKASMPVDERHIQPAGYLHGGASVVLAETLGSIGANLVLDGEKQYAFGLDINANHIRRVKKGEGSVYGIAKPLHIGKSTQVWNIEISNEKGQLVCMSRLTMSVLELIY